MSFAVQLFVCLITASTVALHCVKAPIGKVSGEAQISTPCKIYTP